MDITPGAESFGEGVETGADDAVALPAIAQLTQRVLLEKHAPPAVTVDRDSRIVYFHGDTTLYLVQPPGEPTRDLMAMARKNIRDAVRSALQQAINENVPGVAEDGFIETEEGRSSIEIHAEPIDHHLSASRYYLISFQRVKNLSPRTATGEGVASNAGLEAELRRVRDELQSLREELTAVNAQLQTKMEEHEANSNDLFSLLASTNIAVIFLDRRFCIRNFTPAVKDLIDLIPSDVGRPLSDLTKKFCDDTLLSDAQAVLDNLAPVEKEISSASGHTYMRRVQPYRTVDNRIDGVVITFIDVTLLNDADRARTESEDRYRIITEGARDFAILLMDPDGLIRTWNTGAERLLGYSEAEAIGMKAAAIYPPPHPEDQQAREMEKAEREGSALDETWHVRKNGQKFWGSGILTAVRGPRGELTGFVKILRDETARKQAEDERDQLLATAQAARKQAENINAIKDQFLARLSHELRTPLSSILTWAEMLQHREMTDEQLQEGLFVIERSANAQKELLDDLLDTSRIASGKLRLERTIVDPSRLAKGAVEAMSLSARERGVALELHVADGVGVLLADPDRLRQVISNLLVNAIKFTPSGGRIDVYVESKDQYLELRVVDAGYGIDPQFLPHIFTPFSQADHTSTRSYGGLGLGLAICRELVEMHGGTIRAESEGLNQGSTFIVHLPLPTQTQLEETAIELEPAAGGDADALRGLRILLVEDDAAARTAFARMLSGAGAEVVVASAAEEAFAAFSKSPPQVIVSDVGMPGEDGYELLERIRNLEKERGIQPTPAIALTAFASPQHRRRAESAGFQAHIAKPAKLSTLINAIARHARK